MTIIAIILLTDDTGNIISSRRGFFSCVPIESNKMNLNDQSNRVFDILETWYGRTQDHILFQEHGFLLRVEKLPMHNLVD